MDHDKILHQHPPQSQTMYTIINANDVITSSATDLVCIISSISSNARYLHPEIDKDLIPVKLSQLDMDWAIKKWKYARCFDKMLPRENPFNADVVSFYTVFLKVYEFMSNVITQCLLEYYIKLCLSCNLSSSKQRLVT